MCMIVFFFFHSWEMKMNTIVDYLVIHLVLKTITIKAIKVLWNYCYHKLDTIVSVWNQNFSSRRQYGKNGILAIPP